jgi:hypothetical protein
LKLAASAETLALSLAKQSKSVPSPYLGPSERHTTGRNVLSAF